MGTPYLGCRWHARGLARRVRSGKMVMRIAWRGSRLRESKHTAWNKKTNNLTA